MASAPTTIPAPFPDAFGVEFEAPSPYIIAARVDWATVDTLWGGTKAMRLAGRQFLPQEPLEKSEDYDRRLARTTLHNYYKRTIQTGVAKIFTKDPHLEPITVGDEPPSEVADFLFDVDSQGRNIGQFSKELLEDATNHGVSFLLVDYARVPQEFTTRAEELAAGNRPYWIKVSATSILDARSAKFSDGERLSYFKFVEEITESSADLVTTTVIKQIRVLLQQPALNGQADGPVLFAVYRKVNDIWARIDSGVASTSRIALAPVYTQKIGYMLGKPPLMDLAELNIEHWQKKSDLNNILHVSTVPILFLKGFKAELTKDGTPKKVEVAPNSALSTDNKDADARWIEHNGSAIGSARDDIKDLEARMESLGMVLTTIQHGGVSATANAINTAEANSMLKSFALNLQDALNASLDFTCEFFGIENNSRLVVNTEYAVDYANNETMSDVLDAFKEGVIDKQTVIAEGKRRNVFDNAANIIPPQTSQSASVSAPAQLIAE
jgi:hypothetical protein